MNIFTRIKNAFRRTIGPWHALSEIEGFDNFKSYLTTQGERVSSREVAMTIPAVKKAMQVYTNGIASLPIHVYEGVKKGKMGGRKKATIRPEYRILQCKPSEQMDRPTLFKRLVDDYWFEGECLMVARYNGFGIITDLHYIPATNIEKVWVDELGFKRYRVRDGGTNEIRYYPTANERVIHIIREPDCYGLRGVPLLDSAGEALGLHRQILTTGTAYYRNAVRSSGHIEFDRPPTDKSVIDIRDNFKSDYAGAAHTGDIPALIAGRFVPREAISAEDARILEALASSSATVAMIFNLVPSDLGDQSNSKYNSVAADRQDLITRAMRPIIDTFEVAINNVLFPEGDFWCEMDTDEVLRGDPEQFARVVGMGIQQGYILRSEVRDWEGLEPIEGLDKPLYPLNQGPELAADIGNGGDQNVKPAVTTEENALPQNQ